MNVSITTRNKRGYVKLRETRAPSFVQELISKIAAAAGAMGSPAGPARKIDAAAVPAPAFPEGAKGRTIEDLQGKLYFPGQEGIFEKNLQNRFKIWHLRDVFRR